MRIQVKHHKSRYSNDKKYCTKYMDDKKKACDSGITTIFYLTNFSLKGDKHLITFDLSYYGCLEDILDVDFKSFKVVMFKSRRYKLFL